ncbi:hypothetical protein AB7142_24740 [Escherichia coli]|uniref:hypothetical protein n=2 Tax=Gammaproteobacteria TaxID=1236 RepID=UPI002DBBA4C4|nr:hypothetical protein [Escherichia coli]MEC4156435.1 hypothetical protein [Escherichia coli]
MSKYFFHRVNDYFLSKFVAVRDSASNLRNLMVVSEIVNSCSDCLCDGSDGFDLLINTGGTNRVLVKNYDGSGFFTMSLPFQVIEYEENIVFSLPEYGLDINGGFISRVNNVIENIKGKSFSHEEVILGLYDNFDMDYSTASLYFDAISTLLSNDHGYFRFDDDPENENGRVHPRYHFDFFCNNSSGVKIGTNDLIKEAFFINLFDLSKDRPYLT